MGKFNSHQGEERKQEAGNRQHEERTQALFQRYSQVRNQALEPNVICKGLRAIGTKKERSQ